MKMGIKKDIVDLYTEIAERINDVAKLGDSDLIFVVNPQLSATTVNYLGMRTICITNCPVPEGTGTEPFRRNHEAIEMFQRVLGKFGLSLDVELGEFTIKRDIGKRHAGIEAILLDASQEISNSYAKGKLTC